MHPRASLLLLMLVAAAAVTSLVATHAPPLQRPACLPHERDALLAFKRGITSDPAGLLASWQGGDQDCCSWRGVRCSSRTGHVTKLRLRNINDHLVSRYGYTALIGQISPSLLTLEHLEHLDLSMNKLDGSANGHIPEFLGSLKNLKYLNLSGMPFLGTVPPQLGNLSKLQYLDLSDTYGTNSLDLSWIIHLPFLKYLALKSVDLGTVVDWPHVLNMVPSLRVVDLSGCNLSSANQSLSYLNLTNLEWLDVSQNFFDHPIASCWFWNLTDLKHLNLGLTRLYGQFPIILEEMASLQVLDCSDSSNILGKTPNLTKLCNLEVLNFDQLRFSYGDLFESLPHCALNKLEELHLSGANTGGVLPNLMEHLTSLTILDLSYNNIIGPLPTFIGNFTSLVSLDLSYNHLIGHVPYEISLLTNLNSLRLNNNYLDGVITEDHFGDGIKSLQYIDFSYNALKIKISPEWQAPFRLKFANFAACHMGPRFPSWLRWLVGVERIDISSAGITDILPEWFSSVFSNAKVLNMSNNQLSGGLPTNMELMSLEELYLSSNQITGQIQSLPPNLTTLDISMNSLSGPLPSNFGVPNLGTVFLFSNHITGDIPRSICKQNLVVVDLANNFFEGELPQCFESMYIMSLELSNNSLDAMRQKDLTCNYPYYVDAEYDGLSLSAAIKGQQRNYGNSVNIVLMDMISIDLSLNKLSGELPEDLASLDALLNLNLSCNHLSGKIPNKIGAMQSLESLDLSRNRLSGEIPASLSNLTFLGYLDLSYNNLTGRIPSGSQLDTLYAFKPNMYDGNVGLCGAPLKRNCSSTIASGQRNSDGIEDEDGNGQETFWFGLGLGFTVGLWVVFCTLLFSKTWRFAYFRLFDRLHDKVHVFVVVTCARLMRKRTTAN
ncbi:hypothetical protein ACP70R_007537 [Stipagrostis hirtigluma subsp. patula]